MRTRLDGKLSQAHTHTPPLSFFLSLQSMMLLVRADRANFHTSELMSCGERACISHKHTSNCILRAFMDRYVGVCRWRGAHSGGFICK